MVAHAVSREVGPMIRHKSKWLPVVLMCIGLGTGTSSCAPVSDAVQLSISAQRSFEEYKSSQKFYDFKAFAVQPNGLYYGRAWRWNTPKKAIDKALEICHRRVSGCEIYAVGETIVFGKSPKEIETLVETYFETGGKKASSQFRLGLAHAEGWGVFKDYNQAAIWYRKAAEQGHIHAQFNLGRLYGLGRGVSENQTQALHWYRQAADQGYVPAINILGHRYYLGRGTSISYPEAYYWWSLASAAEYPDAMESRDAVTKHLTAGQLADVQARVDAWFQQHGGAPVHPPQTWDEIFGQ